MRALHTHGRARAIPPRHEIWRGGVKCALLARRQNAECGAQCGGGSARVCVRGARAAQSRRKCAHQGIVCDSSSELFHFAQFWSFFFREWLQKSVFLHSDFLEMASRFDSLFFLKVQFRRWALARARCVFGAFSRARYDTTPRRNPRTAVRNARSWRVRIQGTHRLARAQKSRVARSRRKWPRRTCKRVGRYCARKSQFPREACALPSRRRRAPGTPTDASSECGSRPPSARLGRRISRARDCSQIRSAGGGKTSKTSQFLS